MTKISQSKSQRLTERDGDSVLPKLASAKLTSTGKQPTTALTTALPPLGSNRQMPKVEAVAQVDGGSTFSWRPRPHARRTRTMASTSPM